MVALEIVLDNKSAIHNINDLVMWSGPSVGGGTRNNDPTNAAPAQ
jgi:hypothetical protein